MYKVIGADGKEYGPITANQLRNWISQGRANAATQVRLEEERDWRALESFPEFAETLSQPPTLPNLPAAPLAPPKTSGIAIASLVLGVMGMCGVTAIVGLVLGIVSVAQINKSQGQLKGPGLAIAGIIVSAVFLLLMPAMLLPALAKAKAKAQSIQCVNNVRQISLAVILQANANTNTLPAAASWCDAIQAGVGSPAAFQCAAGDKNHRCHYAYNAKLDGLNLENIENPAHTVLIFETDGGWNLSGGSELLPGKAHHATAVVIGFVDGHVEMVSTSRLSQLQWSP